MGQKTRDITEFMDEPVSATKPDKPTQPEASVVSQSDYRHPDPERQRYLASLFDETWPSMEASIHYLRDR